jgi:hypothetical protein
MLHTSEPLEDVAPDSSIIGPVILVIGWWTVVLLLWHQQLHSWDSGRRYPVFSLYPPTHPRVWCCALCGTMSFMRNNEDQDLTSKEGRAAVLDNRLKRFAQRRTKDRTRVFPFSCDQAKLLDLHNPTTPLIQ